MRELRGGAEGVQGERDHVHLLVNHPPKIAVPKPVNSLKGVPARRIRQEFTNRINRAVTHRHLWSLSRFSASCGGAPLTIIRQYIAQQKHPLQHAGQSSPEMHSSPA